ncbi:MAG: hypothetical protein ABI612_19110 [Betaproteobacteria bacterium]
MTLKARVEKLERQHQVNDFLFVAITWFGDPEACCYTAITVNDLRYDRSDGETIEALENRIYGDIVEKGHGGIFVSQRVPEYKTVSSIAQQRSDPIGNFSPPSAMRLGEVQVTRKLGVPETWLVLLDDVVPRLNRVAVLSNSRNQEWRQVEKAIETAAAKRGMTMLIVPFAHAIEMQKKLNGHADMHRPLSCCPIRCS